MPLTSSYPGCAHFDQFQLDLKSGVLQRSGVRVPVQTQPLQVLRLLLQAEGKVVTREELRKVLWPEDTFVEFQAHTTTAERWPLLISASFGPSAVGSTPNSLLGSS